MKPNCAQGVHDWMGCKCYICGKTRDEGHEWSTRDCGECGICGKRREGAHEWHGCKCGICGKTREEGHEWSARDCEKCQLCGKVREGAHDWTKDCERCAVCGATRSNSHKWEGSKCSVCGKSIQEAAAQPPPTAPPRPMDDKTIPQGLVRGVPQSVAVLIHETAALALGRSYFVPVIILVPLGLVSFIPHPGPLAIIANICLLTGFYWIYRVFADSNQVIRLLGEYPMYEGRSSVRKAVTRAKIIALSPFGVALGIFLWVVVNALLGTL